MEHHLDSQVLKKTEKKSYCFKQFYVRIPKHIAFRKDYKKKGIYIESYRILVFKNVKANIVFKVCLHTAVIRSSLFPCTKYPQSKQSRCQELESKLIKPDINT